MLSRSRLLARKLCFLELRNGTHNTQCQEIKIPVPWGHLAGKWWGPTDKRPVLTLHGWQDNCGSFNRLIPLLDPNVGFLAIDFPGHGHSSRIPSGLYTFFFNYVIAVKYIVKYFNWPKVSLMGHSMGGITSFIYTSIHPEDVEVLICLDGAKPMIRENNAKFMASEIENFFKYSAREQSSTEPPSYTIDEIKQKIVAPNDNSVMLEHSHHIAERNIGPSKNHPGKFHFTRDPRLKCMELMNWPQEESLKLAENMKCPMLIAKAISGSYYEVKRNFYEVLDVLKKSSVDCQYKRFDGTHHFHLNNPEKLAVAINLFLAKYHSAEGHLGGITEEIKQHKACL